jgi:hypothetical protein
MIGLRADASRGQIDPGAASVRMPQSRSLLHRRECRLLVGLAVDPEQPMLSQCHGGVTISLGASCEILELLHRRGSCRALPFLSRAARLAPMSALELVALASSLSLLAGWRLYFVTLVTGVAMKWGFVALPDQLRALDVLASNWVIGIAAAGTLAEFFADKIAWVDSAWDAIHTWVRPLGGALLSLAIIDAGDPAVQVGSFLLGGGAAFLAHAGKAGARAMVNASPEPVSNVIVSTGEDVATGGLVALAIANPIAAALIALVLVAASLWLVIAARRLLRRLIEPRRR